MRTLTPDLHPDERTMLTDEELEELLRERSDLPVDCEFRPLLNTDGSPWAEPLVSSRVVPRDWSAMAGTIGRYYDDYDGFVILHGTDTMAWTASALSFMLVNLAKPVVLTGSQKPILATPSDAVSNFTDAVMLAGRGDDAIPLIPEVVVCFGDLVLRGNRVTKVSAASLQGFASPNYPALGRVGRRFDVSTEHVLPQPATADFFARLAVKEGVADVMLYPGLSGGQLNAVLAGSAGAVLRTFGAGNAPGGPAVEKVLRGAADRGVVLVNVTQSNEGTVEAGMLSGSRALTDCGVVTGVDMTAEAALTKLMVLLANDSPDVVREQMQLDQRGEQSMDVVELRAVSGARGDGVTRLVLSHALAAGFRPDRLVSAVLRVRLLSRSEQPAMTVHLNRWTARPDSPPDVRTLGRQQFVSTEPEKHKDVVLDATDCCRGVLGTGRPVTVTVVPDDGPMTVQVTLTLFLQRGAGHTRDGQGPAAPHETAK